MIIIVVFLTTGLDVSYTVDVGVWSIEHGSWASENTLKRAARDNVVLVPTLKASYDIIENADSLLSYMVRNALQTLSNARRIISNMIRMTWGLPRGIWYATSHGCLCNDIKYDKK